MVVGLFAAYQAKIVTVDAGVEVSPSHMAALDLDDSITLGYEQVDVAVTERFPHLKDRAQERCGEAGA